MRSQDVARVAKMAPALKSLVVLSMPDCLLIDHWSATSADADSLAARFGAVLHAVLQTTSTAGGRATADLISIETPDVLLLVAPIGGETAAGFIFDRGTALGMARIQIRDMLGELEPAVQGMTHRPKPPAATPIPAAAPISTLAPPPPSAPEPAVVIDPVSESSRPRAVRLLEFLHRYAPDPHVSLLRLSLRTGIALEKLDRPELLSQEQVEAMATSVRDIIGQEQLGI